MNVSSPFVRLLARERLLSVNSADWPKGMPRWAVRSLSRACATIVASLLIQRSSVCHGAAGAWLLDGALYLFS